MRTQNNDHDCLRSLTDKPPVDQILLALQPDLVRKVKAETGATSNYPYDVIDKAEATKAIVRRKSDEHYVVPKPQ